jgi:Phage tail lysozyme
MARRRKQRNPSTGIKLAVAAAVGLGVFLFARKAFGAQADLLSKMSPKYKKKLTATKTANVKAIEEVFLSADMPENLIAAAVANSYHESGWNAEAVGDGGHSIGLFQLNDWGAGSGLTVEYRKDPRNNARTILDREVLAKRGKALRDAAAQGTGVGELAAIFSRDIERPADKEGNMASRKALAEAMFPSLA